MKETEQNRVSEPQSDNLALWDGGWGWQVGSLCLIYSAGMPASFLGLFSLEWSAQKTRLYFYEYSELSLSTHHAVSTASILMVASE